jgi:hypothetical protein
VGRPSALEEDPRSNFASMLAAERGGEHFWKKCRKLGESWVWWQIMATFGQNDEGLGIHDFQSWGWCFLCLERWFVDIWWYLMLFNGMCDLLVRLAVFWTECLLHFRCVQLCLDSFRLGHCRFPP